VRDYIYEQEWQNLRGIQIAAAEAIFHTDDHVLLTASTASGKTEAAFFPIITVLESRHRAAMYHLRDLRALNLLA